ncbi:VWA domain-containing protein [Sulfitobacter sp. TSTF-M16]|uniref:VWA domain-containing protein n=2 Tax=Sulfitobacter aestuariivivens TaxID=2766981 RepID=A0A927DA68_9RHOB|nr:VWA domain-containing protein [Sulfitobacter aestuariivivens]
MLVFDGSSSMSEVGFDTGISTRIDEARQAVARIMPQVEHFRRIGLLTYGPGGATSCTGLQLHFLPQPRAGERVAQEIGALEPSGLTPLSAAVEQAAEVLAYRSQPAVVVLVTDGNETCGGRPCTLGRALAAAGHDLTVHVIGFRVSVDFFTWNNPEQDPHSAATVARCLADETGGTFVSTETVDELVEALRETVGCPLIGQFGTAPRQTG